MSEAEPLRASIFETNGKVFHKAIDDPDIELPGYDLRGSRDPAREAILGVIAARLADYARDA